MAKHLICVVGSAKEEAAAKIWLNPEEAGAIPWATPSPHYKEAVQCEFLECQRLRLLC